MNINVEKYLIFCFFLSWFFNFVGAKDSLFLACTRLNENTK